jgi:hypothetical protein
MMNLLTARRARTAAVVCGVAAAAWLPGVASAGVVQMTFESLAHSDNMEATHGSSYEENGFRVQTSMGEFSTWGTAGVAYPGSTALMTPSTDAVVTLTAIDGSAFDLLSIQIAKRDTAGSILPVSVTFTGTKADSSTVTATFNGTVFGVMLQTFTLPAEFTDLVQVQWTGTQRHQFDNVTLVSVPAPSAAAVLVAAAGCVVRRRRR